MSRETAPLTAIALERLLVNAGKFPHPAWLEFQDRYAGYIEEVGPGDIAVWGLARSADSSPPLTWLAPNTVGIQAPVAHMPESAVCADAHPVHGYELGSDGSFYGIGGPAVSFEIKIERHGVMMEFLARGKAKRTLITRDSSAPQHQQLLAEMEPSLVPEASDRAIKLYLEPKRLLRFHPFQKQLVLLELDPG